ncbi:hypothetical protein KEM48_001051 [Puccinia striiformis f. sp. tritici PST-130]|nr:hypothetical protein KEM48_001051 [Puccinia striiformis f. sp. tritici PST-130]
MYLPKSAYLHESIETIESEDFFDVLIIGGGPHALGLAARLREPRPAALYTDIEHSRLAFLQRPDAVKIARQPKNPYALRAPVPNKLREQAGNQFNDDSFPRLLALDGSSSEWLGRWNGFFHHLDIPHLRSPMFFHPSPADVDGLEAFAKRMDREKECVDSGGVEDVLPTVGQSKRVGIRYEKEQLGKKVALSLHLALKLMNVTEVHMRDLAQESFATFARKNWWKGECQISYFRVYLIFGPLKLTVAWNAGIHSKIWARACLTARHRQVD